MIFSIEVWGKLNPVRRTPLMASIRTEISRFFPKQFPCEIRLEKVDPLEKMNKEISEGVFKHTFLNYDVKLSKKSLFK